MIDFFLRNLQERGIRGSAHRLYKEIFTPSTGIGKALRTINVVLDKLIYTPIATMTRNVSGGGVVVKNQLWLFYDLEVSPITFDFCWALALAEKERERLGLQSIHIVFVPGSFGGLRKEMCDYESAVDADARRWRIQSILMPLCSLLPSCSGYTVCTNRQEAQVFFQAAKNAIFPTDYRPFFPTPHIIKPILKAKYRDKSFMSLRATHQAREYVSQWLTPRAAGRKVISITLRQYNYMPSRNSNIAEWAAFASALDQDKYFVVIVPDTDTAMAPHNDELSPFPHFNEACWNVGLRAALYELSYLCLGVNNGPFALCWLNENVRYIMFKVITESAKQTTTEVMIQHGYTIGEQLPFSTQYQKWVWEDDTKEIIQREFEEMNATLSQYKLSQ